LLKFAPIMPAFCSLLLCSYYSKNYSGKIGSSLAEASPRRRFNTPTTSDSSTQVFTASQLTQMENSSTSLLLTAVVSA